MGQSFIQLLVLVGIAVFLIIRLKSVLGTREGFEKPPIDPSSIPEPSRPSRFEVIEGGPDRDIVDHVPDGSAAAKSLAAMKMAEPGFGVSEFLGGAGGAYEMILMAYENGDIEQIRPFLSAEVFDTFAASVAHRQEQGLTIEASFVGLREAALQDATYDRETGEAEITVRLVAELTSVVRNASGEVVEGDPHQIKRQRDVWTFARVMGADDPNWQLVATGE